MQWLIVAQVAAVVAAVSAGALLVSVAQPGRVCVELQVVGAPPVGTPSGSSSNMLRLQALPRLDR